MRLVEPHPTIHERQAVDGRRDADRYKTAPLEQNVRLSQIYPTYVWTQSQLYQCRRSHGARCGDDVPSRSSVELTADET